MTNYSYYGRMWDVAQGLGKDYISQECYNFINYL